MTQNLWTAMDDYLDATLVRQGDALARALEKSEEAGLPAINVTPAQGKFLHLLAKLAGARRILEIGTLGGYSAIWLASALPDGGLLTTLEYEEAHAAVARKNIARAGLTDKVAVKTGRALDLLPTLSGPFDMVFIDADKPANPDYFQWALKLCRKGAVIVVDNVVRGGAVADPRSEDANAQGVRRMNALIAAEKRVEATALQTVGAKGYDGFCLIRVSA